MTEEVNGSGNVKKPEVHPRQKRWHVKTRTGCRTCKRRRVKCDERQPTCEKCGNSGLKCDGYEPPPKAKLFVSSKGSDTKVSALETSFDSSKDVTYFDGSNDLKFALGKFSNQHRDVLLRGPGSPYSQTSQQFALKYWLDLSLARGLARHPPNVLIDLFGIRLPQVAWDHECVRHGLVAAATIMLAFENDSAGENQAFSTALARSGRDKRIAISSLLQSQASPEVHALTAMILWVAESWSGHFPEAALHLQGVFNIVREVQHKSRSPDLDETFTMLQLTIKCMPEMWTFHKMIIEISRKTNLDEGEQVVLRKYFAALTFTRTDAWMKKCVVTKDLQPDMRDRAKDLYSLLWEHSQQITIIMESLKDIAFSSECAITAAKMVNRKLAAGPYPYTAAETLVNELLHGEDVITVSLIEASLVLTFRSVLLFVAQSDTSFLRNAARFAHKVKQ